MRRTLPARVLVIVVSALALGGLAGCGSGDESSDDVGANHAESGDTSSGSETTPAPDEVSLPDDVCSLLTADEVGAAVGGTVTLETGPSGDCQFSQEDARALSGSLGVVGDAATNGGYDGYLAGIAGTLTDPQTRGIDGLGQAASTFTGVPSFGGSTMLMAGGVVDRGEFLEQTTLSQATSMTADQLDPVVEALLRLLDGKLS